MFLLGVFCNIFFENDEVFFIRLELLDIDKFFLEVYWFNILYFC